MIPVSTSPVPAVASRASPAVTMPDPAVGCGDDRGRALEQHDGARSPRRARGPRRAGRRRAVARSGARTRRRGG